MSHKVFTQAEQDTLEQIMHQRRDVRGNRFTDQPVSSEHLHRILQAGLMAPSVGFSQPWRFVIIKSPKIKQGVAAIFAAENERAAPQFKDEKQALYQQLKLEGITEAPINIAVFHEQKNEPVLGQTSMSEAGPYSSVCAVQNMWLMARALNIGMGWVSILDAEKVETLLSASPNQKLIAYLCVGHVDTFYDKPELETLGWETRKQFEDLVFEEKLRSK